MKISIFNRYVLFGTIIMMHVVSCTTKECCVIPPSFSSYGWSTLSVGDQIRFRRFVGDQYYDNTNHDFQYTDDTLILEFIGSNGSTLDFKEYLSPGSSITTDTYYYADSIFYNSMQWTNDSLIMYPTFSADQYYNPSHLLTDLSVPLARFSDIVDIIGWKTDLDYEESYRTGYDDEHSINDYTFRDLNIIVDNTAMQVDGPGHTLVYNRTYGIIRSVRYSWWTQTGQGWDLILQ